MLDKDIFLESKRYKVIMFLWVLFIHLVVFFIVFCFPVKAHAEAKVKDLVNVKGVRHNSLLGYGLVIGLSKTGDTQASVPTRNAIARAFTNLGIKARPEGVALGNIASVIVTGNLPPFSRIGDKIDIRVSANGDAKSLAGGTLIQTTLRAGNGEVFVVAQGAVVVGQADGSGSQVLTVARVPQGGSVEREFIPNIASDGFLYLSLKKSDFTTNYRIVKAINDRFRSFYAVSLDPSAMRIKVPENFRNNIVKFVSKIEQIKVKTDQKAVVVLNERTGTVVLGNDITINPATIAHGDLSITVKTEKTDTKEGEEYKKSMVSINGANVGSLVEALNQLGVKPLDLVGIIQALHKAGAINGDLEFM